MTLYLNSFVAWTKWKRGANLIYSFKLYSNLFIRNLIYSIKQYAINRTSIWLRISDYYAIKQFT